MWVQTYRPPMIFGAQLLKQTLMELRQWLAVFAPSLLVTLAGLTVFREAIWRSIASSAHPSLVYLILLACLVALVLCAFTLNHYQKEMREVQPGSTRCWCWGNNLTPSRQQAASAAW